jgi:hypothetical protein
MPSSPFVQVPSTDSLESIGAKSSFIDAHGLKLENPGEGSMRFLPNFFGRVYMGCEKCLGWLTFLGFIAFLAFYLQIL